MICLNFMFLSCCLFFDIKYYLLHGKYNRYLLYSDLFILVIMVVLSMMFGVLIMCKTKSLSSGSKFVTFSFCRLVYVLLILLQVALVFISLVDSSDNIYKIATVDISVIIMSVLLYFNGKYFKNVFGEAKKAFIKCTKYEKIINDNSCLEDPSAQDYILLSDIHIPSQLTMEGGVHKERVINGVRGMIAAVCENSTLILLGDMTDSGHKSEWKFLAAELERLNSSTDIILVPGNHDVAFNDSNSVGKPAYRQFEERCRLFLKYLSDFNKQESYAIKDDGEMVSLSDYIDGFDFCSRSDSYYNINFNYLGDYNKMGPYSRLLCKMYPVIVKNSTHNIIILNSCVYHGDSALTSGVGRLGEYQLSKLRLLCSLDEIKAKQSIVLIHHHLAIPGHQYELLLESHDKRQINLLGLLDADKLFEVLEGFANPVVVHGHLHAHFDVKFKNVRLISVPSATYGDIGHAHFTHIRLRVGEDYVKVLHPSFQGLC